MLISTDLSVGNRHVRRLARSAFLHGALADDGGTVTPVGGVARSRRQRAAVHSQARHLALGCGPGGADADERLDVFYPGNPPSSRRREASSAARP